MTAKELLHEIDRMLMNGDSEAGKLWDILSALRGPDNHSEAAKEATIKVRAAAFPLTAERVNSHGKYFSFSNSPLFGSCGYEEKRAEGGTHFEYHIDTALDALALLKEE